MAHRRGKSARGMGMGLGVEMGSLGRSECVVSLVPALEAHPSKVGILAGA